MATPQRSPRDVIGEADAEYQRLAEQHRQYDAQLQQLVHSPYHSGEDLIEEIRLKKMKLHLKDEMERLSASVHSARAKHSQ
ncbi:MAG TPA: YdcH family protein [Candidatus Acidoferrum sp.]|jgi:uncharacterized protein YdcH (DUF465 family)|nr:YdcH family protein [Candidatus Acidoferrum sp.]